MIRRGRHDEPQRNRPRSRIRRAALALAALIAACSPDQPVGGPVPARDVGLAGKPASPRGPETALRDGPPSEWVADYTLLVFAANDDRDTALVTAFDNDALEWQTGLGGSALFRILVQRDYAPFQAGSGGEPSRASERYALYREERQNPEGAGRGEAVILGETDTSNPDTLRDFLVYGVRRFPARHYWVVITGHGDGWNGLADDATTGTGKRLSIGGLKDALAEASRVIASEIRPRPGLGGPGTSDRVDVVQFDVCRLGSVEVATTLSDVADYMIASQETVPDAGHPYGALRYIAQDHTDASPRALVSSVVNDYVRAYVEGVSTVARDYVGTSVTSVGLDLRRMPPLVASLANLVGAVQKERPQGFSCDEIASLVSDACDRANVRPAGEIAGGRSRETPASAASIDLVALLESLADPARCTPGAFASPVVSEEVVQAAQEALRVIGRPALQSEEEPDGIPLLYGGQFRKIMGFSQEGPFVSEAHRVDPGTGERPGGLSVLWGDPFELLYTDKGVSPLDTYRSLSFEAQTGWTKIMAACIAQAEACYNAEPDPTNPDADPCEDF
jgi:hypothetical protein